GSGKRPNILLVTYDALTAKDMSLYGYHRETTPFISEWAKTATVFSRCEAAANTTSQTVASLMTGKRVWTHRRHQSDAGKPLHVESESLPLLLKNNGYYNMAFIANNIASVKTLGMADSFDVMPSSSETLEPASLFGLIDKGLIKYFGGKIKLYDWLLKEDFLLGILLHADLFRYPDKTEFPVKKVFDMFLREIDNDHQQPFFAWIHLFPPHAPYLPPDEYMGSFEPSPEYRTAKSQYPLINKRYYDAEQQPDADIIRGRYDEFVRYCDKEFNYLIKQLSSKKDHEDTVIILSSDHGESFERGYFTHGGHFLFEEMTHIPLIIKKPAQDEGRIIGSPVEQADIPATILDLAGIPVPMWMDGRSLGPLLQGGQLGPRPVFSMSMEENRVQDRISKGIFAVWENDYKLIHLITSGENMLFNLKHDPGEHTNLYNSESEVGQHLLGLIQDNLDQANEAIKEHK
ncbi:MAG: sulfatase, partial [Nitrospirae bacterium]|nr:sulfatase [Nitrospirota bacterium]